MKFNGIGHIALRTKNYDEMAKFYTEVLEFPKAFDLLDEEGKLWISYFKLPSGQFIEVFPKAEGDRYTGDNRPVRPLALSRLL